MQSEMRSRFFESADISFTEIWSEKDQEYRPVTGSYFDHCEMIHVPDGIGENLIKSFSSPENFLNFSLTSVTNSL